MSAMNVTIIVVSFNTREKLLQCLGCIAPHFEVVVVDNNSQDGSADMVAEKFPNVHLVRNQDNRGFGAANNQGCEAASGDLVLYLNSDAYASPGAIETLAEVFSDPSVVAAGGMLLNPDQSLQQSVANELTLWAVFCEQTYLERLFRSSRVFSPYWTTTRLPQDRNSETPQVMGACLMVRANQGKPIELFDERYFLYCEDTDLCRRLSRHGKILYVPSARFVHDLGSSSKREPWRGIARYNAGKELYFRIHHGASASLLCLTLDRLGALMRLLAWILAIPIKGKRAQGQVRQFWKVLTCPFQGPTRS